MFTGATEGPSFSFGAKSDLQHKTEVKWSESLIAHHSSSRNATTLSKKMCARDKPNFNRFIAVFYVSSDNNKNIRGKRLKKSCELSRKEFNKTYFLA
jgi:hypothetical protein